MRVVAFIGDSNSGKTTLICALIRHFVTSGKRVAAIKHTHHPLTEERGGDTAAFEAAGATPVILAANGDAIAWSGAARRRLAYQSPADLLVGIDADIVLVEGFKNFDGWPRINAADVTIDDAIALVAS